MDEEMQGMRSEAELEEEESAKQAPKEEKPVEGKQEPAKEPPKEEPKQEPEGENGKGEPAEPKENGGKEPPKDENPYHRPGHTPAGVQERINKLTKSNYDLKREIEDLKRQLGRKSQGDGGQGEPTKEDFLKAGKTEDDYFDYRVKREAALQVQQAIDAMKAKEESDRAFSSFSKNEDEARKFFPDYDSVVYGEGDITCRTNKVGQHNASLPNGPEILYVLHSNPELRQKFEALDEQGQLDFLDGMSAHLSKAKAEAIDKAKAAQQTPKAEQQQAPSQSAPAKPEVKQTLREPAVDNGGKPVQPPDLATCSMEEFERYYGTRR
jgi:hypothetical protein